MRRCLIQLTLQLLASMHWTSTTPGELATAASKVCTMQLTSGSPYVACRSAGCTTAAAGQLSADMWYAQQLQVSSMAQIYGQETNAQMGSRHVTQQDSSTFR